MDTLRNFGFLIKDVARLYTRNFERHATELELRAKLEQELPIENDLTRWFGVLKMKVVQRFFDEADSLD